LKFFLDVGMVRDVCDVMPPCRFSSVFLLFFAHERMILNHSTLQDAVNTSQQFTANNKENYGKSTAFYVRQRNLVSEKRSLKLALRPCN
jgi:hypothetical protein